METINFEQWKHGFSTIYESIWVGITNEIAEMNETDTHYIAVSKSNTVYSMPKALDDELESLRSALKSDIEFLFACDRPFSDVTTESILEFQYQQTTIRFSIQFNETYMNMMCFSSVPLISIPHLKELTECIRDFLLEHSKHRLLYVTGLYHVTYHDNLHRIVDDGKNKKKLKEFKKIP